jgi:hypothetical protein
LRIPKTGLDVRQLSDYCARMNKPENRRIKPRISLTLSPEAMAFVEERRGRLAFSGFIQQLIDSARGEYRLLASPVGSALLKSQNLRGMVEQMETMFNVQLPTDERLALEQKIESLTKFEETSKRTESKGATDMIASLKQNQQESTPANADEGVVHVDISSAHAQARVLKQSLVSVVHQLKGGHTGAKVALDKRWSAKTVHDVEDCVRSISIIEARLDAAIALAPRPSE